MEIDTLLYEFNKHGGILQASELKALGFSSRQINKLVETNVINRIKYGYYELVDSTYPEEVIIARLFPQAIVFLESALMYYGYTDRIPPAWQIAVNKNSEKTKYKIDYPIIEPFYLEPKFLEIGTNEIQLEGVSIKIFDRDRTICDILKYENKLEREVFVNAIQNYVKDPKKNVRNLIEYSKILNIKNKVKKYIEVWL